MRALRFGRLRLIFSSRFISGSSMMNGQDHYSVLEVGRNATAQEIKNAFYKLSARYHPDRNPPGDKEKSSAKFQSIVNAYEVLGNESRRKEYDLSFFPRIDLDPTPSQQDWGDKGYTDLSWKFKNFGSDSKDIQVTRSRDFYRANAMSVRLKRWDSSARASEKEDIWKDPDIQENWKNFKDILYYVSMGVLGIGILKSLISSQNGFDRAEETETSRKQSSQTIKQ